MKLTGKFLLATTAKAITFGLGVALGIHALDLAMNPAVDRVLGAVIAGLGVGAGYFFGFDKKFRENSPIQSWGSKGVFAGGIGTLAYALPSIF